MTTPTPQEVARRLTAECAKQRATAAELEAHPAWTERVAAERRSERRQGRMSVWDDPLIQVRASEIEAITRALLDEGDT